MVKIRTKNSTISIVMYHYVREVKNSLYPNLKGLEYATGIFSKWAKYRKMQPRDKKGRFGSYATMGYILANSIKNKGVKATMFFSKPFDMAIERLPDELFEAFVLDVENAIILGQKR